MHSSVFVRLSVVEPAKFNPAGDDGCRCRCAGLTKVEAARVHLTPIPNISQNTLHSN